MKRIILSVAVIAAIGFTSCNTEAKKETVGTTEVAKEVAMADLTFGVRGNCGMCKKTIEKAVNAVDGVSVANWDVKKKKVDVTFDGGKTDAMAIHNAIAASGYDTEKVSGSEEAYKTLPGCCKYDHEMEMNQSGEGATEEQHMMEHE